MTSVQDHPAALRTPQHISVTQVGGVIGAVVGQWAGAAPV
jgi:hypothetical protein